MCNAKVLAEFGMVEQEFQNFGLSLVNNGLFILPPLLWNIAFASRTPSYYSSGSAPIALLIAENILRAITLVSPFAIPIQTNHHLFYPGLTVYSIGLAMYFSSWLLLMYFPDSAISKKVITRLLPAFTPLVWLIGIGLMSQAPSSFSVLSTAFIGTHGGEYLCRLDIIKLRL
jgi:hypothetical protein